LHSLLVSVYKGLTAFECQGGQPSVKLNLPNFLVGRLTPIAPHCIRCGMLRGLVLAVCQIWNSSCFVYYLASN